MRRRKLRKLRLLTLGSLLLAVICLLDYGPARMVSAAYQMVKGPEVTEIVVPYHVLREGDTLEGICCRLKDEYGDKRDWREIAFYVCKDNNKKDGWVYLGEKINVRLHVPVETK